MYKLLTDRIEVNRATYYVLWGIVIVETLGGILESTRYLWDI